MPSENVMRKDPRGLDVIEALAPKHSRFAVATKEDYFTVYWGTQNLRNILRTFGHDPCEVWDSTNWVEDRPMAFSFPRTNCELVGLDKLWRG